MILDLPPSNAEAPTRAREEALAEFDRGSSYGEAVSRVEPKFATRFSYRFDPGVVGLEGGRILLRLREPLTVELDYAKREAEVAGWGLRFPVTETGRLHAKLARRFLELFSKADRGELSEAEESHWVSILDQTDYRGFCIDRAAPHYVEGRVVQRQPNFVRVEWHDGECENIAFPAAAALHELEKDDEFSAHVKLGLDHKTLSIERVVLLAAAS